MGWATIITKISTNKKNICFLLWGSYAQKKHVLIDSKKHLILQSSHPSPLSAYRGFLDCKHFSKTNEFLLANKTTAMLHGKEEAQNAESTAKETFSGDSLGKNLPLIKIREKDLKNKINIIDLIVLAKLKLSKSEIRRLIKGCAIKINNEVIEDEKFIVNNNLFNENYLKLSIGKKRHIKIQIY